MFLFHRTVTRRAGSVLARADRLQKPRSRLCATTVGAQQTQQRSRSKTDRIGAVVFTGISALTFGFGVWQTKRYFWKVGLVEDRKSRLKRDIIEMPDSEHISEAEREALQLQRVSVEGTYEDDSKSVILGPRVSPVHVSAISQSGYYVYTPMKRPSGEVVVVNRGWVPKDKIVDGKVDESVKAPDSQVKVTTVVSTSERKGYAPENDVAGRHLYWLDPDLLRLLCGASSKALIVDQYYDGFVHENMSPPIPKHQECYTYFTVHPYTHMGYAATWFGLSVAAMAFVRLRFLK